MTMRYGKKPKKKKPKKPAPEPEFAMPTAVAELMPWILVMAVSLVMMPAIFSLTGIWELALQRPVLLVILATAFLGVAWGIVYTAWSRYYGYCRIEVYEKHLKLCSEKGKSKEFPFNDTVCSVHEIVGGSRTGTFMRLTVWPEKRADGAINIGLYDKKLAHTLKHILLRKREMLEF